MKDQEKYNVTEEIIARSLIKGSPENMFLWIEGLKNDEFDDWFKIANRLPQHRSQPEIVQSMFTSVTLLSYELDTMELGITQDKMGELLEKFYRNILLEAGRREGIYILPKGLTLAGTTEVLLTEKGREIAEELYKKEQQQSLEQTYGRNNNDTTN